ncbi:hypothetical protein BDV19DRAFT_68707 [Aspergillus venezuelensis]
MEALLYGNMTGCVDVVNDRFGCAMRKWRMPCPIISRPGIHKQPGRGEYGSRLYAGECHYSSRSLAVVNATVACMVAWCCDFNRDGVKDSP